MGLVGERHLRRGACPLLACDQFTPEVFSARGHLKPECVAFGAATDQDEYGSGRDRFGTCSGCNFDRSGHRQVDIHFRGVERYGVLSRF
jgi:hypothetical protein